MADEASGPNNASGFGNSGDDEIKNKAHKIIDDGIKAGRSDQQIVQDLREADISGWSEEDVARRRRARRGG